MRTYVINLARSPDRRTHMLSELRKAELVYEFVEGIEGRDLDLMDTTLVDQTWLGEGPFWPVLVGCSSSHLKVYQKVLGTNAEHALVLEDDVILPDDMGALVDAASRSMTGAEVALLHHHRSGHIERGRTYRLLTRGSVKLPGSRILATPRDLEEVAGAGAYIITREACQRMVEMMLPVKARADEWAIFCEEGALDTVRCVAPMPVLASPRFRTTMDHYAPRGLQPRLRNAVTRRPVVRHALALRRSRLMARKTQVEVVDES